MATRSSSGVLRRKVKLATPAIYDENPDRFWARNQLSWGAARDSRDDAIEILDRVSQQPCRTVEIIFGFGIFRVMQRIDRIESMAKAPIIDQAANVVGFANTMIRYRCFVCFGKCEIVTIGVASPR